MSYRYISLRIRWTTIWIDPWRPLVTITFKDHLKYVYERT